MMETIRIRQQGFGNRLFHKDFLERYRILAPGATTAQESVEVLSKWLGVTDNDWQMGYTKIFMRQVSESVVQGVCCHDFLLLPSASCCVHCLPPVCRRSTHTQQQTSAVSCRLLPSPASYNPSKFAPRHHLPPSPSSFRTSSSA